MDNVIVILGPTASGKTKLAIALAKEVGGEIISADSMQIYKDMNIGTAKPDIEEMDGIKHYLIDEIDPSEAFNVVLFQQMALEKIEEILNRGKIPIVCGGTGLYISSLINNIQFSEIENDEELRESLLEVAKKQGNRALHDKLREIDPVAADNIHPNNVKRVIRAIEVYTNSQKTFSHQQEISRMVPSKYRFILFGMQMPREKLYANIEKRVDQMINNGLIDEVKMLKENGLTLETTAMQGLGYKEVFSYLNGLLTIQETIYLIKKNTRHFAKRQMTWFRRIENITWLEADKGESVLVKLIKDYIATNGIIL
jgi:tRNA dimethylallyltransferase